MSNGSNVNYLRPERPAQKKPRKKLPARSKKRVEQEKEYARLRQEWLKSHPVDKLWCIRNGWRWDGYDTETNVAYYFSELEDVFSAHYLLFGRGAKEATEVHHGSRRGKYLLDTNTWHELSAESHRWVESHAKEAEQLGLLDPARNTRKLDLPPK